MLASRHELPPLHVHVAPRAQDPRLPAAPLPALSQDHYSYAQPLMGDGCLEAGSAAGCDDPKQPVVIPAASPDGRCGGSQQALAFLRDVPPFACTLAAGAAALPLLCATTLNASFLQQQKFAATPDVPAALAPALQLRLGAPDAPLPNFTAVAASDVASTYDAGTATCQNALVALEYLVGYNDNGAVTAVTAYLTLADVAAGLATLRYAAAFAGANAESSRELSGRPGYVRGKPVLVADGTDTLELRRGGLRLLGIGPKGECDPSAARGAELLFGEALEASCTTALSYAQLPTFCEPVEPGSARPSGANVPAGGPELLAALGLDWSASSVSTYFGAFGDAHPAATDDWVGVTMDPPKSMSYVRGECSNVLAGIHVRLLTADVGAVLMPVKKIIGAHITLSSQTVTARRCALGVACDTHIVVRATTEVVDVPEDGAPDPDPAVLDALSRPPAPLVPRSLGPSPRLISMLTGLSRSRPARPHV